MIMKKRMVLTLLFACVLLTALSANAQTETPSAQKKVEIRIAHDNAVTTPGHKAFLEFEKMVETATDGRISITIFPGGQMGSVTDAFEMTRRGDLEMSVAATTLLTQTIPEFAVWDSFYLFDNAEHAHAVLDGAAGKKLLEPLDRYNLKGLGYMEIGFRNFSNSKRAVVGLADLSGLKIRGYSPMQIKAWSAVGTNLTSLSWTEVFTSLQQNLIDGQECATSSFYDARFYEAQKYWSLTEHIYTNWMWYVNKNFWNNLSAADQALLSDSASKTIALQRQFSKDAELIALDKIKVAGIAINEVPIATKRQMGDLMNKAVKDEIVARSGSEVYDFVMNYIESSRK